jgi:hypothetical protein
MEPVKEAGSQAGVETVDAADKRLQQKGQTQPGPRERRPSTQDTGSRRGRSRTGSQTTGDMTAQGAERVAANLTLQDMYANLDEQLTAVAEAETTVAQERWVVVGSTLMNIYIREKAEEKDARKSQQNIAEIFETHGLIKENLLRLNVLIRCSDLRLATKREKDALRGGITLQDVDGNEHTFNLDNEAGLMALRTLGRSMTSVHDLFAKHINATVGRGRAQKPVATLEEVADTPEQIKHRVQNEEGKYESKAFIESKPATVKLIVACCRVWGPKLTQEERDDLMDKIDAALNEKPAFVPQASKQQQARKTA